MKWILFPLVLVTATSAHSIFQRVYVNGADQGQLIGLRAPPTDYPLQNVGDSNFACNAPGSTSSKVINVAAGGTVGSWWGHVLGGAQYSGDPDNPIASSHKGPIQAYLAKVDNAASASSYGQKWFKIASEGLSGGKWGVDTMIQNGGLWSAKIPECVAPGNYLLRIELLALHSASQQGQAQFYMSCAQINVTGGGSFTPSSTVSFPGAYSASDPGILLSIYDNSGNPYMGGRTYTPPGPAVISCSGSNNGGGQTSTNNSGGGSSGSVALYGQCGGQGYTGATTCASGTCKVSNQWYSQCLP